MGTTTRRLVCEVCGLGSPTAAWRENRGICPNCHQPYKAYARGLLEPPTLDLGPEGGVVPQPHSSPELDDWWYV